MRQLLIYSSILLLFTSCASSYRSVHANKIKYQAINSGDALEYSYRYDILRKAGNKKLAKKEDRKNIHLVAFQLKNNTSESLIIGEDIQFYADNKPLYSLDVSEPYRALKQHPWMYALYLPIILTIDLNANGEDDGKNIPIGLGIGVGNFTMSMVANKRFATELFDNYLRGKVIRPGEVKSGLLAFRMNDLAPIEISIEE